MAYNTFDDLKATIAIWLARSDITSYVDDFISLSEDKLARDLRIEGTEVALSATVSTGTIAMPSDLQELKFAYVDGTPVRFLEIKPVGWIYRNYPTRSSTGKPRFISLAGSVFEFGPFPDSNYVIKGVYWKKPTALSSGNQTNEWTTHTPDALFLGALLESAPFLGQDERIATWQAKYADIINGYTMQEQKRVRREALVTTE